MKPQNESTQRNLNRPKTNLAAPERGAHRLAKGRGTETLANASSSDRGAQIAQLIFRSNHRYIVDILRLRQRHKIFPEEKVLHGYRESYIDFLHQLRTTRQQF